MTWQWVRSSVDEDYANENDASDNDTDDDDNVNIMMGMGIVQASKNT